MLLNGYVPPSSSVAMHSDIEHLMLTAQPQLESAFKANGEEALASITYDFSFVGQMKMLAMQSPSGTLPDIMLFTADSAIPVADAVRGYCLTSALQLPILSHVETKFNKLSHLFQPTSYSSPDEQTEVARLRQLTPKQDATVCVVDQFVYSGETIRYAARLAKAAGYEQVSAVSGQWYHEAHKPGIDKSNLTSSQRSFFYGIGQRAALELYKK